MFLKVKPGMNRVCTVAAHSDIPWINGVEAGIIRFHLLLDHVTSILCYSSLVLLKEGGFCVFFNL